VEPGQRRYDLVQFLDTKLRCCREIGHQSGGLQIELESGLALMDAVADVILPLSTKDVGNIQEG
jgi:hypothetical protein